MSLNDEAAKRSQEKIDFAVQILAKLYYYDAKPVEQYKDFNGWYRGATVVDTNAIDYKVWQLTGKHLGEVGMPRKEDL